MYLSMNNVSMLLMARQTVGPRDLKIGMPMSMLEP